MGASDVRRSLCLSCGRRWSMTLVLPIYTDNWEERWEELMEVEVEAEAEAEGEGEGETENNGETD